MMRMWTFFAASLALVSCAFAQDEFDSNSGFETAQKSGFLSGAHLELGIGGGIGGGTWRLGEPSRSESDAGPRVSATLGARWQYVGVYLEHAEIKTWSGLHGELAEDGYWFHQTSFFVKGFTPTLNAGMFSFGLYGLAGAGTLIETNVAPVAYLGGGLEVGIGKHFKLDLGTELQYQFGDANIVVQDCGCGDAHLDGLNFGGVNLRFLWTL